MPSASTRNSRSGTSNSANPQFKQTRTLGKAHTEAISKPSHPGKCMFISVLNVFRSFEEHRLQIIAGTNWESFKKPQGTVPGKGPTENAQFEVQPVPRSMPHQRPPALVKVMLILWFAPHSSGVTSRSSKSDAASTETSNSHWRDWLTSDFQQGLAMDMQPRCR